MEKPSLKPNVWIDEGSLLVENPSMQTLISPSLKATPGKIVMISTPSGKPFDAYRKEFSDWYWFEHNCKVTLVGKLLYG